MPEEIEENDSTSRYNFFFNIGLPLIAIIFSKNMNERISFPLNKKYVATGRNKGFVEDIFSWDGKTASNGRVIWNIRTNGVHYPENHFPLARMKDLLKSKSILDVEKALTTRSICKL